MPRADANGIALEYDVWGESGDPVLIIAGHAGQLTAVPDAFMAELVARGFRPIRFDNRDVGLSTGFDAAGLPDFNAVRAAMAAGRPPPVAYTLVDMAADAVGLLDALGVERAHVFGGSMGGMIAQLVAADYPDRVKSLVSFMSSSGAPHLPTPAADVAAVMQAPIAPAGDLAAIVEHKINIFRRIGSPAYPTPVAVMRERFTAEAKRSLTPGGVARQSAAILATGDRRERLKTIRCPTVVIHGAEDPLVPLAAGEDTARHIPGAVLRVVSGMGHDFPDALAPVLADAVSAAARRAPG
jgi:pimeloyl-ACP methyl ester carboxylesterase